MNGIFVDTGAWYALVDRDDECHETASAFLVANRTLLILTNAVFSETITLIRFRLGHRPAVTFGRKLKESNLARIVAVTPPDEDAAWEVFVKYRDHDFSFADCTSFMVMKRLGLDTAFAFDRHFREMRFTVVPARSR